MVFNICKNLQYVTCVSLVGAEHLKCHRQQNGTGIQLLLLETRMVESNLFLEENE